MLPNVLCNLQSVCPALQFVDFAPRCLVGAELFVSNQSTKSFVASRSFEDAECAVDFYYLTEIVQTVLSSVPALGSQSSLLLWDVNLPQTVACPKGSPSSSVLDLSETRVFDGSISLIPTLSGASVPWFTYGVLKSAWRPCCPVLQQL